MDFLWIFVDFCGILWNFVRPIGYPTSKQGRPLYAMLLYPAKFVSSLVRKVRERACKLSGPRSYRLDATGPQD